MPGVRRRGDQPGRGEAVTGERVGEVHSVDDQLVDGILPLAGDLVDRLAAGIRVADVGCGTGHAVALMARAFPRSTFVGYDFAEDAIAVVKGRAQRRDDGWTVITADGSRSAHFEHTIAVTDHGPEVLTLPW